jgi:hypothetical protein
MLSALSNVRKAIVAAIGVILSGLTFTHNLDPILNWIPGGSKVEAVVGILIVILTPIVTWWTPNAPASSSTPAGT